MVVDKHVLLLIEYLDGQPLREPVHVVEVGNGLLRVCYSPGFVPGIAADDVIRLVSGGRSIVRDMGTGTSGVGVGVRQYLRR